MQKDPYKYFRIEAKELLEGLDRGVLDLEKPATARDAVGRLLRVAHTLKGASRVVRQAKIGELAHAFEDALGPHREPTSATPPQEVVNQLLAMLDEIKALIAKLDAPATDAPAKAPVVKPPAAAAAPIVNGMPEAHALIPAPVREAPAPVREAAAEERIETLRVEIAEVDALLESISELGIRMGAFRRHLEASSRVERAAAALVEQLHRRSDKGAPASGKARILAEEVRFSVSGMRHALTSALERAEEELSQVVDRSEAIRLVPASVVFAALERGVRDAAQSVDKPVELFTQGGETRLDGHVLSALREALLHVVTNAVTHGVESAAERKAAGKPPISQLHLTAERKGSRVVFSCRDDGKGVDIEAVRRLAVQRGLVSASDAAALSPEQVVRFIFSPGLTTASQVTALAGRGVGMDVVREVTERLKGEVVARSERGKGTTVEISVPLSLTSLTVLVVEAGEVTVAVPMDAVRRTRRVLETQLHRSAQGDCLLEEERAIPFVPLSRLLRGEEHPVAPRQAWSVLVLRAGGDTLAVGVDRIREIESVVLRRLPALAGPLPVFAGASFDSEGNPQPVVDAAGLIKAARELSGAQAAQLASSARPPVLVIDDSLTTRMMEKSILESAGYEVDLAVSAEDGLAKAGKRAYGLFVCDVDMPGMSGFDFVTRTRQDQAFRRIPAILVTSRSSEEDRRRGATAGASAFIVKGEFDQGVLLGKIRELIG